MSKGAYARRLVRREAERARARERREACARHGWIRRHARVPYTGSFLVIDGVIWQMIGWSIEPPALRLFRPGQWALCPIEDWKAMTYDPIGDAWRPAR